MSFWASSRLEPSGTVMSRSRGVMMLRTGWSSSDSKRRSRLVTMPTTFLLPPSTTGRPEMRCSRVMAMTSRTVMSGVMVMGSPTTPDS